MGARRKFTSGKLKALRRTLLVTAVLSREAALLAAEAARRTRDLRQAIEEKRRLQEQTRGLLRRDNGDRPPGASKQSTRSDRSRQASSDQ